MPLPLSMMFVFVKSRSYCLAHSFVFALSLLVHRRFLLKVQLAKHAADCSSMRIWVPSRSLKIFESFCP